ncbi:MAG: (2Fe-2S)-binding protein [Clostridia bacterium]
MSKIIMTINGQEFTAEASLSMRLLDFIRDIVGLKGTKEGCGEGECGACTVLVDGEPIDSCLMLVGQVAGSSITTIEGLGNRDKIHPIQQAFVDAGAVQCGFCTPGMVLTAKAILDKNSNPTEEEIRTGISGNMCRCTGYTKIVQAIQLASKVVGR